MHHLAERTTLSSPRAPSRRETLSGTITPPLSFFRALFRQLWRELPQNLAFVPINSLIRILVYYTLFFHLSTRRGDRRGFRVARPYIPAPYTKAPARLPFAKQSMSVVYQTVRTACRRWAPLPTARAAASVRCFIIPSDPGGSGQAKSVKDADRVDLWGNSYDPDSRWGSHLSLLGRMQPSRTCVLSTRAYIHVVFVKARGGSVLGRGASQPHRGVYTPPFASVCRTVNILLRIWRRAANAVRAPCRAVHKPRADLMRGQPRVRAPGFQVRLDVQVDEEGRDGRLPIQGGREGVHEGLGLRPETEAGARPHRAWWGPGFRV